MEDTDLALLRRFVHAHDADAFSQIVGRYQDLVYNTCFRTLGNPSDAEDVAQECFLRLLQEAGAVRTSLAGWLHRCATGISIDEVRRRTARKNREEAHGQMNSSSHKEPTWHELGPHLDKALDDLPDELRIVVVEHFLQRRTQAEIAGQLGVSPMTVSRRIDRGIDELRKELGKAGVVVSVALLTSLVVAHAATAAPLSVAAALGKVAIAGAVKAGTASGAATGWTGAGVAAGTVAGAAKVKIIAVAVAAALAAGGIVAHKMAKEPEQPPAAGVQAPTPADEAQAEDDGEKAEPPVERTLLAVMPEGALGWCWVSSIGGITAKLSTISEELGPEFFDRVEKPLPENVFRRPCAVILWPSLQTKGLDYLRGGRNFILLLEIEVEEADGFYGKLGQPDADGIRPTVSPRFSRPDPGPLSPPMAPEGPGKPFFMKYRGYVAIGGTKECLKALAAAKPCMLSEEATKIMGGAQAFAHINIPQFAEVALGLQIRPDREGMAWWAYLAKEMKSADIALHFDEEGVTLKTLIEAREGSALAKYLVPSEGLGTLEPPLPVYEEGFGMAVWANHDSILETLIDDSERLAGLAFRTTGIGGKAGSPLLGLAAPAPGNGGQKVRALALKIKAFADSQKGFFTGRFSALAGLEGPIVVVAEATDADEIATRAVESATDAHMLVNDILSEFAVPPMAGIGDGFYPTMNTLGDVQAFLEELLKPEESRALWIQLSDIGNKIVLMAMNRRPKEAYKNAMEKTLAVLQGKPDAPALNDDPMVRTLAAKIGLDNNLIMILSPDLTRRIRRTFGNPPFPATYAVVGLKAPKPGMLRCDVYMVTRHARDKGTLAP